MLPRLLLGVALLWCGPVEAATCRASWYGYESGSHTASGERFRPDDKRNPTCAMPSYRAGHPTFFVRVTNVANHLSVICKVNDRGPAAWTHKCIDLSRAAADLIGMRHAGVATVTVTVLKSRKK